MDPSRHGRIKEIFSRVEELPPEEREAFLEAACGEDAELRREVERLLEVAAETPDSFLEPVAAVTPGQSLGHYRVASRLGRGGMGEVWQAEDSKLKRQVALKVLPPTLALSDERLRRFQREAEAVAALNHPNIVTVHSVEEAQGIHFLTMELVEGKTLAELLPQGGFGLERFLELAVALAGAVCAAHEKGILHRDLKPGNVMVTEKGHLKVLDFGLAKVQQEAAGSASSELPTEGLTGVGMLMGTASYMSPEQAEGKPVDHRSDIFSLGVVLYEMASGRPPFEGDSPAAVMSSILRDRPQPLTDLRSDLPRHLTRLVMQCLEKDPRDRFQSARDIYNELRGLQRETVSDAERSSDREPSTPVATPARRLGARALAALLAAAAVALGAWWLLGRGRAGEDRAQEETIIAAEKERKLVAVLPLRNLGPTEDAYFADGITDEIISRLATVRGLGVISSGSTAAYRDTIVRAKEIGEALGVDYILSGSVRWARQGDGTSRVRISPRLIRVEDDTHLWAEVYDRPMDDIFDIQSEIALKVAAELGAALLESKASPPESRPTQNQEAYQAYLRGLAVRHTVFCPGIRASLDYLHRAVELDPGFAQAWTALSRAHSTAHAHCPEHASEDRVEALQALKRAQELAPGSWQVLEAEAKFLTQVERDYERALGPLEQASRLVDNSEIHFSLGRIYRRMGRWEEALAEAERGVRLDPISVYQTVRLAAVHHWMRNYPRAIQYYDRSIELAPEANTLYLRKAWVYWLWQGDTDAARSVLETLPVSEPSALIQWGWFWQRLYEGRYREAIEGLELLPDEGILDADIYLVPKSLLRAQAYRLMGKSEEAQAEFAESIEILQPEVEKYPAEASYWDSLAIAYAGAGRKKAALAAASRATALLPLEREPYFGSTTLLQAALVHTMVGEHEAAVEALDRLLAMPSVVSIPWLRLDPRWAPLWEHPGFQELVEKYG